MKAIILLSLCALLAACGGEKLKHYHQGNDIVERHIILSSWDEPGRIAERTCTPAIMEDSQFWAKKVCPSDIDKNARLSVDRGHTMTASYKDLVVPAVIQGSFFVAGMGTLGAVTPRSNVDVRQMNNVSGSTVRTSTLLINSPVPGGVAP